jgi:hypothetical protein
MLSERPRRRTRNGFTIAELLLVLVLGALVLGLVSAIGLRLQRQLSGEATRLAIHQQLDVTAEMLAIDLRGISPGAGDIPAGAARDSSIQLRATIGNAIVCSASNTTLLLAPFRGPGATSIALAAQSGDTLWISSDADTAESWRPVRLQSLRRTNGSCAALTDAMAASVFDAGQLWAADVHDPVAADPGSIVRITRPEQFSFYRGSDGRWYLGLRSWNVATSQFNLIQPISGPYAPASGGRGVRFRYYDDGDRPLVSGVADTRVIARIEAVLIGEPAPAGLSASRDSQVVVVAFRNRR